MGNGKKTSAAKRKEQSEEYREARERYNRQKAWAREREKKNYTYLIVVKTHDGWYKMFGHSAVIYVYDLCPKMKKNSRIHKDNDFYQNSSKKVDYLTLENVYATVRSLDILKKELVKIGITPQVENSGVTVFNLTRKYNKEQLNEYIQTEEQKWQAVVKLNRPKEVMPELYKEIRLTTQLFYETIRRFPIQAREYVGMEMFNECRVITRDFIRMVEGHGVDVKTYLEETLERTYVIQGDFEIVANLRLTEATRAFTLRKKLEELRKQIILQQKKLAKREKRSKKNVGVDERGEETSE